jgi:alpha-tubulin suppressor-like RCC1 family protein
MGAPVEPARARPARDMSIQAHLRHLPIVACLAAAGMGPFALLCCADLGQLDSGGGMDGAVDVPRVDTQSDREKDRAIIDRATLDGSADGPLSLGVTTTLAAGGYHTCAIRDGGVYCFGDNGSEQVSPGATCDGGDCFKPVQVVLDASSAAVEVTGGVVHTCALLADGTAWCWGDNTVGELGLGGVMSTIVIGPLDTSERLVRIAAGDHDTCAVGVGGDVLCWGTNTSGQLGTGDEVNRGSPTRVPSLKGVVDVGLGQSFTCALLSDGGVECWGSDPIGTLTCDAGALCSLTPVPVAGLDGVDGGARALAVGLVHACVLMADSTVRCWGGSPHGELGDGTFTPRAAAAPVQYTLSSGPVDNAVAISAGVFSSCAVLRDGGVACWGLQGFNGQDENAIRIGISRVARVALGSYEVTACVLFADGGISCAGDNSHGALGRTDCIMSSGCPLEPVVGLP